MGTARESQTSEPVDVRLLGRVALLSGSVEVDAGPAKQRCVLAALAVHAGRPVPTGLLIDRVWGAGPPACAHSALYSYLTRLRRTGVAIARTGQGYVLDVSPDHVDLLRFRTAPDPDRALAEWRGEPLAGLAGDWARVVRAGLHRRRVELLVAWAETALALGNAAAVVERIAAMIDDYPHDEPLISVLLRGLHAQGRTAEALARYEQFRARLHADVSATPNARLGELHLRLLRNTVDAVPPPAELPAAPRGFTGRAVELVAMSTSDRTVLVTGLPGIGKTALALSWAHQLAHRFPDGQLYADLRSAAPGQPATGVLAGFLRALGVADGPVDVARYRAALAGRRVLVLLDDVADLDQVRPLLPDEPGCRAVLTSRRPVPELPKAHRIQLGPLSMTDAVDVLADRLGADRVAAERAAVAEVARLCAGFPLALRIAAVRLLDHPGYRVAAYAAELRDGDRLCLLETEDAAVRTAFDAAVRLLPAAHWRLLRSLGRLPDDTTAEQLAAVGRAGVAGTRQLLRALAATGLVVESATGRYGLPGLVRCYVAGVASRAG